MTELGEFTHDNLIAGDFPLVTQDETVLSGESVVRGELMGKITASAKLKPCDSTASDGSEAPYAIMAEDVDASAADAAGITYHSGQFNQDAVTFGGTDTAATHRAAMRALGLHLMPSENVTGTIS